jgi:monovalent cation:H+ antiporter-2, CPA2 family
MGELSLLTVLILMAATVFTLATFRRLNMPPVFGYVMVGAFLGPGALAVVPDFAQVRLLAEFGVAFLLFTLGLEFSIPRLRSLGWSLVILGSLQVVLTTLVVVAVSWALGIDPAIAVLLGGIVAMSSTAVMAPQLAAQGELTQRHGSLAIGVSVFQDIAVVPYLALVPVLAGGVGPVAPIRAVLLALVALVIVLAMGHWLLRPFMREMAQARLAELFTLTILLVVLGAAWVTEAVGLSLALGAFLAGLMLAETEFRHRVETDIRPFRDLLLGLFFITVGMSLDFAVLLRWWPLVVGLLLVFTAGKAALVAALMLRSGESREVSLKTAIALGQGGEFGIAILTVATQRALLDPVVAQLMLTSIVISMAVNPLLIRNADRIVQRLGVTPPARKPIPGQDPVAATAERDHVVICGFGRVGQNLGRILEEEHIEYIAVELDHERVRVAREAGDPVIWGDCSDPAILSMAGLAQANLVVTTIPSTRETLRILAVVKEQMPGVPVLVRARDDSQLELLQRTGATEVVPETLEASLMLASHMLALLKVPLSRVVRKVQQVREDRYAILRTVFRRGVPSYLQPAQAELAELQTVTLPAEASAIGRKLGELGLEEHGVVVTAIRREGIVGRNPLPDTQLREQDVLVLFGRPEDLEHALKILFAGGG